MSDTNKAPEIGPRDIVFSCPVCQKNMVVDEVAEGLTVECPGCGGAVIVPAKANTSVETSAPAPASTDSKLSALISKLKELQTQRTEISTNIVARLNDINRQMVLLARLENTHQQVMQEWNRVLADLRPGTGAAGNSQANFKG
ncbi:MAG: hypothetical protein FJ395_11305 [Verrucomicrobia bacterium]|nr:hypothetical protein [Verrucomicrobiota bacterium]